jgi:hypothetical protein
MSSWWALQDNNMKTKIDKQVAAAQKRVQRFIVDSFVDLQLETAAKFKEARERQAAAQKK